MMEYMGFLVYTTQFSCKPKTALKEQIILKNYNKQLKHSPVKLMFVPTQYAAQVIHG